MAKIPDFKPFVSLLGAAMKGALNKVKKLRKAKKKPKSPGAKANDVGLSREMEVANLTNGKVAKDAKGQDIKIPFTRSNGHGGKAPLDVIGGKGEYIAVGGPGKAKDLSKLGSRMSDLKLAADQNGVRAMAYFTKDTPKAAIDLASKKLGPENVVLF